MPPRDGDGKAADDGVPDDGPTPEDIPQPPPDLQESLRQVGSAGKASLRAAADTGKALRSLVSSDFSLARSAFGRTLAFTGVAIVFGASAWLLLMTALIVFLSRQVGWPWWSALLACAAISIVAAGVAVHQGMRYFEHTRMKATRRQLARLGIGELADLAPDAGSSVSSREAAERLERDASKAPIKDRSGIEVTPP